MFLERSTLRAMSGLLIGESFVELGNDTSDSDVMEWCKRLVVSTDVEVSE